MKEMIKNMGTAVLMTALFGGASAFADELDWNNALGDNDFANPSNFVVRAASGYNFLNVSLTGDARAIMSAGTNSVDDIRVGIHGDGELEFTGGYLKCNRGSGDTRLGLNGYDGTVNMSGGQWDVGQDLAIGLSSGSTGIFNLSGGVLNHTSGRFTVGGNNVTGLFAVSGGDFSTYTYAQLYEGGTFEVIGGSSSTIVIGNESSDGAWIQDAGSTLKIQVDTNGVSPISVVDAGNGSYFGNVELAEGALLDVSFVDGYAETGTWTIIEFDGNFINLGLEFTTNVAAGWDVGVESNKLVISYGENAPDLPVVTTPLAPTGVYALPDANDIVTLRWDALENATLGYTVYRSLDDTSFSERATGLMGNSYVDTAVTNGVTYYYKVSGVNDSGEGELSDADAAKPTPYLIIGTDGTYQNNKSLTKHQLFDGDVDTYFDASSTGSWAGLDFGAGNEQRIYEISFVIRGGWGSAYERCDGAYIEGANTSDFSDAVRLHTVSTSTAANYPEMNVVSVTNSTPFRYVRLHSSINWPLYSFSELGFTKASDFTEKGTSIPWLEGYGLTVDDEYVDNDGDGLFTWEEYVAGTSPIDASSVLALDSAVHTSEGMVLTWQSVEGINYSIITNTSLMFPQSGTAVSGISGAEGQTSYTTTVSGASSVFYTIGIE